MFTFRHSSNKLCKWALVLITIVPLYCSAQNQSTTSEPKSLLIRVKSGYFNYGFLNNGLTMIKDPNRLFKVTTEVEALYQKPLAAHWRFSFGAGYLRTPMAYKNSPQFVLFNQATNSIVMDEQGKFKWVGHDLKTTANLQGYLGKKNAIVVGLGIGQISRLFTTNFTEFKDETGEIVKNKSIFPSFRTFLIGTLEVGYNFKLPNQNELMVSLSNSSNISSYFNKLGAGYIDFNVALGIGYKLYLTRPIVTSPSTN